jgi:thiol-disulfide isomerase/thioredoxin
LSLFSKQQFGAGILIHTMTIAVPRKTTPLLLLGLGLILIATSAYLILQDISSRSNVSTVPVQVSFPAPELTLMDTQGISRSLVGYRSEVVLVNLWATWCPPCKEEMPALQSFYDRHKDEGFVVIAINDGDPTKDVLQFVKDYRLTFPVWLDPTYIATEQAFKTRNLPSSFVIDRTGMIRLQWVGGISRKMLDQYVSPLIMEQP